MADFGDDIGNELNNWIRQYVERRLLYGGNRRGGNVPANEGADAQSWARKLGEMAAKARQWYEHQFRSDPQADDPQTQALARSGRTPFAVEMPSTGVADSFAAYARDNGVWAYSFEGVYGEPMVGFYKEDAQEIVRCAEEWVKSDPEAWKAWNEYAKEQVRQDEAIEVDAQELPSIDAPELPPAEKQYMKEIREKVEIAREGAVDKEDFIRRCEEQGLSVGRATDGELLFTHENGWFDVRGDTLGKEYTHDAFERGVGERAEPDAVQKAIEEQELYIQSHDGGDIDTRTRVVENPVKTGKQEKEKEKNADKEVQPSRRNGKDYDLDSEAKDMRDASQALDSGRGVKEIGPLDR